MSFFLIGISIGIIREPVREFPSTDNLKILKTEATKNIDSVEPAIELIDSFLKTGTEDFYKRETHNSESDDEPCCSKHIQRKREWQHEREILLARCKATENSQQVLRNVRGILEQLRKRYFSRAYIIFLKLITFIISSNIIITIGKSGVKARRNEAQ